MLVGVVVFTISFFMPILPTSFSSEKVVASSFKSRSIIGEWHTYTLGTKTNISYRPICKNAEVNDFNNVYVFLYLMLKNQNSIETSNSVIIDFIINDTIRTISVKPSDLISDYNRMKTNSNAFCDMYEYIICDISMKEIVDLNRILSNSNRTDLLSQEADSKLMFSPLNNKQRKIAVDFLLNIKHYMIENKIDYPIQKIDKMTYYLNRIKYN